MSWSIKRFLQQNFLTLWPLWLKLRLIWPGNIFRSLAVQFCYRCPTQHWIFVLAWEEWSLKRSAAVLAPEILFCLPSFCQLDLVWPLLHDLFPHQRVSTHRTSTHCFFFTTFCVNYRDCLTILETVNLWDCQIAHVAPTTIVKAAEVTFFHSWSLMWLLTETPGL